LSAPLPAAAHRVSLDGPAVPAILPPGPLAGRVSFDEQDALAERNDTLWDLVVQLRDHVEHLRGERAAQAEEIKRLRVALADAAHELKVLRANALSPAEAIQSRRIKPPTGPQVH
jgi:hypothetical protein